MNHAFDIVSLSLPSHFLISNYYTAPPKTQQMGNFLGLWPAYQDHPSVSRSLLRAPAPAPLARALHPLRRGQLLRARTLGGLRACLHPAPDSDQCGGGHCQPGCPCVHPGGSKAASQAENVGTW